MLILKFIIFCIMLLMVFSSKITEFIITHDNNVTNFLLNEWMVNYIDHLCDILNLTILENGLFLHEG